MPSPFPGMNPYLEQDLVWHDFHESFMPAARDIIAAQVRPKYVVKIDEHMYIHELPSANRRLVGRADVAVTQSPRADLHDQTTAMLLAPAVVGLPGVDVERVSFLEIRDRANWQLVSVIELLSPANKESGPDREQYLAKRSHLLSSAVHLVEIDLLRGGPRMPLEDLPLCDYYALVSRVEERPRAGIWPIQLRQRLPEVPIPLLTPSPDARLDLQNLLNHLYDSAQYDDWIYEGRPQPPLRAEDDKWASAIVQSR